MGEQGHGRILDPAHFHVAWIAPLEIEAKAALAVLDQRYHGRFPMNRGDDYLFKAGSICGHQVVIATIPEGQPYGTNSAAALASQIRNTFHNLKFCLLVGIAAGLPGPKTDIRLGDVLVAVPDGDIPAVVDYELGKQKGDGTFELLRGGHVLAPIDRTIGGAIRSLKLDGLDGIRRFRQHYEKLSTGPSSDSDEAFADPGQENDHLYHLGEDGNTVPFPRHTRPLSSRTRVWHGPIGSGNKLSKDTKTRDRLRDTYNVRGLEMEAAGIMNILSTGVIRGVCDYGDERKNDDWHPYAAAMAASYAKAVLSELHPQEPVKPPPRAMSVLSVTGPDFTSHISACLRSIGFPELNHRFNSIEEPAANTALWVMQDHQFCSWHERKYYDGNPGVLWFKGKPGSGKSTIMKFLAKTLSTECLVTSFFFSSSGSLLQKTPLGMYRSLAYQLAKEVPAIRDRLVELWREKSESQAMDSVALEWHEDELKQFLRGVFKQPSTRRTVLFIEALDECDTRRSSESEVNHDQARGVASFLQDILGDAHRSGVPLDVCISSRSSFQFGASGHCVIKVDQHNQHDLETYVDARLKRHVSMRDNELSELRREIVKKASGMFLWAKMAVDRLLADYDGGRSLKYMMRQLDAIPAELLNIYRDILAKPKMSEPEKDVTTKLFQWVILGTRPFRLQEWRVIMGLIQSTKFRSLEEWSESVNYPTSQTELENQIRRISRGLVEVSSGPEPDVSDEDSVKAGPGSMLSTCGETRTVQVIHTSVRDLFLAGQSDTKDTSLCHWQQVLVDGHSTIIQGCLDFINVPELDSLTTARQHVSTYRSVSSGSRGVSSFHSAASWSSRGSSMRKWKGESPVDGRSLNSSLDSEQARPESPFHQNAPSRTNNLKKPLGKSRRRKRGSSSGSSSEKKGDHRKSRRRRKCRGRGISSGPSSVRQSSFEKVITDVVQKHKQELEMSLHSSVQSQILGQADITVLLDYASIDIFDHIRVEQSHPERFQLHWLKHELESVWHRLVLLRDDLRKDISLLQYCAKMDLDALFILFLEDASLEDIARAFTYALSNDKDTIAKFLVFQQMITGFPAGHLPDIPIDKPRAFETWHKWCMILLAERQITTLQVQLFLHDYEDLDRRPLMTAIEQSNFAAASALVDLGVGPRYLDGVQTMNLICEHVKNWDEVVAGFIAKLLRGGLEFDRHRSDALHHLCGRVPPAPSAAVKYFLDLGLDPNMEDGSGWTPLGYLCCRTFPDSSLFTGKHWKEETNPAAIVKLLLDAGANPNTWCGRDDALATAARVGNEEAAMLLINAGAIVNNQEQSETSALIAATKHGHQGVVDLLLNAGAEPNTQGGRLGPALIVASRFGHGGVVSLLLNAGADPNIVTSISGGSALIAASHSAHEGVVSLLLAAGADPNLLTTDGTFALMVASTYGCNGVVRLLLDAGADPNLKWGLFGSPLIQASVRGHEGVTRLLLDGGASIDIRDSEGRTALEEASSMGLENIVELLVDKGARRESIGAMHVPDGAVLVPIELSVTLDEIRQGLREDGRDM